jgi:hypothetical protein
METVLFSDARDRFIFSDTEEMDTGIQRRGEHIDYSSTEVAKHLLSFVQIRSCLMHDNKI